MPHTVAHVFHDTVDAVEEPRRRHIVGARDVPAGKVVVWSASQRTPHVYNRNHLRVHIALLELLREVRRADVLVRRAKHGV